MKFVRQIFTVAIIIAAFSSNGFAQIYVEVDPLAYIMKGYSLHTGYVFNGMKIDAGVFGLEVPQAVHGNKDFTVKMGGFGAKWHYLGSSTAGWFAGFGAGYTKTTYSVTGGSTSKNRFSFGVEGGYRFEFENTGLYIMPWLGIDHAFGDSKTTVNGKIFEEGTVSFFPTVHIGWAF